MNDVRGDQDEQLGAIAIVALGRKQRAEDRDILEERNPVILLRGAVADQPRHYDCMDWALGEESNDFCAFRLGELIHCDRDSRLRKVWRLFHHDVHHLVE